MTYGKSKKGKLKTFFLAASIAVFGSAAVGSFPFAIADLCARRPYSADAFTGLGTTTLVAGIVGGAICSFVLKKHRAWQKSLFQNGVHPRP